MSSDELATEAAPTEEMPGEVDSDPPSRERLSQRQRFIAKADKMCERVLLRLAQIPLPTTMEGAKSYMKKATRLNEVMLKGLRILTPPRYREVLSDTFAESERLNALARNEIMPALERGDVARYRSLAREMQRRTIKLNAELRRFGFGACADPA